MIDSNDRGLPPTRPTGDSDEPTLGGEGTPPADRQEMPVGPRSGQNPANIGDEVPTEGDITFPEVVPAPAQI
jgi:hypothetical protein